MPTSIDLWLFYDVYKAASALPSGPGSLTTYTMSRGPLRPSLRAWLPAACGSSSATSSSGPPMLCKVGPQTMVDVTARRLVSHSALAEPGRDLEELAQDAGRPEDSVGVTVDARYSLNSCNELHDPLRLCEPIVDMLPARGDIDANETTVGGAQEGLEARGHRKREPN